MSATSAALMKRIQELNAQISSQLDRGKQNPDAEAELAGLIKQLNEMNAAAQSKKLVLG